ncbi:MAG: hypothetical protein OJF62_002569 [Pseudolabrys sp.]|jgi:Asp-tRNA(Asn)/Glu-tRNA(Gln) amidotransferase C subunit|nr:hypothetical protein [Pseudolabrys sp.]
MVRTLEKAIAEVEQLSATDQEQIGQKLLSHVEKLKRLRADVDQGIASLDAGLGVEVDIEEVIARKNKARGG